MRRAHRAGVRAIVTSGVGPQDWSGALEISGAQRAPAVFCALGLHPYAVSKDPARNRDALRLLRHKLEQTVRTADETSPLVALGECGLDFRKNMPLANRDLQIDSLREQLRLASSLDLPCVIHCVRAHGTLLELLGQHPIAPSVMHAFSGSEQVAQRLLKHGHYLSFAGNLTRTDAKRIHRSAQMVPAERMLIESDSPDQTPQGRGGIPNEPAFVTDVVAKLAQLRNETPTKIAAASFANACRVYRITRKLLQRP